MNLTWHRDAFWFITGGISMFVLMAVIGVLSG